MGALARLTAPTPRRPEQVAAAQRTAASTTVAVLSTLICYTNFGAGFANWFYTLAIDSMVNDLMLLLISWRNEIDDEALAQEAQFSAAVRAGTPAPQSRPQSTPPQASGALQPTMELSNLAVATMQA